MTMEPPIYIPYTFPYISHVYPIHIPDISHQSIRSLFYLHLKRLKTIPICPLSPGSCRPQPPLVQDDRHPARNHGVWGESTPWNRGIGMCVDAEWEMGLDIIEASYQNGSIVK